MLSFARKWQYLTVLEWLGQHLSMPFQDSCLVGELVELRDVVCTNIRPAKKQVVCMCVCLLCFCLCICVSATLLALCKRSPTRLRLIALFWNVRESVEDNDHVDLMDHNAFDYGPHNMGDMPVRLSYQPHLYRDRTRTKVLCRKLSATFSWWSPLLTLSRVSPSRYPKVSPLTDGNMSPSTISGPYKTDLIVFMVIPNCPYFQKNFIASTGHKLILFRCASIS